jgi:acyl-CoA thioesterase I
MVGPVPFRRFLVGLVGLWSLLVTTTPIAASSLSPTTPVSTPLAINGPRPSTDQPRIVAFGDSLTAGLGVGPTESYPAQLQRRLEDLGYHYRVVNAGVSGETTAGGVRRVAWVLKSQPAIVILELGANDGLRGLNPKQTQANLERIIQDLQQARVTVVLAGMKLPPNYGAEYTKAFEAIYPALARQYHLKLIPFFLEGIAGSTKLNQADGIHPTAEGYRVIVGKILETVQPLLKR